MAPIALDHVEKVYSGEVKALDDLKLEVKEGEFMVLVGPGLKLRHTPKAATWCVALPAGCA
jgi:ABC-type taurine transport system ATPase subunit